MTCPGYHRVEFKDQPLKDRCFKQIIRHETHEKCLTCKWYHDPGYNDMVPALRLNECPNRVELIVEE